MFTSQAASKISVNTDQNACLEENKFTRRVPERRRGHVGKLLSLTAPKSSYILFSFN